MGCAAAQRQFRPLPSSQPGQHIAIVSQSQDVNFDGSYQYRYYCTLLTKWNFPLKNHKSKQHFFHLKIKESGSSFDTEKLYHNIDASKHRIAINRRYSHLKPINNNLHLLFSPIPTQLRKRERNPRTGTRPPEEWQREGCSRGGERLLPVRSAGWHPHRPAVRRRRERLPAARQPPAGCAARSSRDPQGSRMERSPSGARRRRWTTRQTLQETVTLLCFYLECLMGFWVEGGLWWKRWWRGCNYVLTCNKNESFLFVLFLLFHLEVASEYVHWICTLPYKTGRKSLLRFKKISILRIRKLLITIGTTFCIRSCTKK